MSNKIQKNHTTTLLYLQPLIANNDKQELCFKTYKNV